MRSRTLTLAIVLAPIVAAIRGGHVPRPSVAANDPARGDTTASLDSATRAFYAGRWSCAGQFASGRPIGADVEFALLDERWMLMDYRDRPPNQWRAHALWGRGQPSAPFVVLLADNGPAPRAFSAATQVADSIVLHHEATTPKGPADERFTFTRTGAETYRMRFDIEVAGTVRAVGHVDCARKRASER